MSPDEAIGVFMIAIAVGVVQGIAVLLLIYKMVDGDLPVGAGLGALVMIGLSMALAIHPPHPVVPGVILVLSLTLMAFFPFAEQKLEEFELRAIDAARLSRCFEAVRVRPDNFAAKFDLARLMYAHGFHAQAMQLTGSTLATLSEQVDEVRNRSLKDIFHKEQILLTRWQQGPQNSQTVKCPGCGAFNRPEALFCTGCSRPYMLDIVQGQEVKPRVWAKLVLAWATLALFLPAFVAIGMNLEGILRVAAFAGSLVVIGLLIAWLFRPPAHAPPFYS